MWMQFTDLDCRIVPLYKSCSYERLIGVSPTLIVAMRKLLFLCMCAHAFQWVYNILDGQAERDRVVFSDPDPETGFVLLPDLKWDSADLQNLYMLALVRRRDVSSMRELNQTHLPLLKNILTKGKVSSYIHHTCII